MDVARDDASEFRKSLKHINQLMRQGGSLSGHERNCLFLNTHGSPFATASAVTGFDLADDARGAATVDWDADGDLDVWLSNRTSPRVRFLRNNQPNPKSITFTLKGTRCNRDAIGAQVRLYTHNDERPITKTVRAGEGFLSQSSKDLVFGLGRDDRAERITITWPGGEQQHVQELAAGRYRIVQDGNPERLSDRSTVQLVETSHDASALVRRRVGLTNPIPAPRLPIQVPGSEGTRDALESTGPTLVNLWASWCQPCLVELAEFRDRYDEIQAADLTVQAICVDDALEDKQRNDAVLAKLNLPFPTGNATKECILRLTAIHDVPFISEVSMPVPLSFLMDADDHVVAVYRGPVSVDRLLNDVAALRRGGDAWQAQALPLQGRWNERPPASSRLAVPRDLLSRQQTGDALHYLVRFETELADDQALPVLRAWLGDQLFAEDRVRDGLRQYAAALRQDPNDLTLINNYAWQLATGRDATLRDGQQAVAWAERAAKLTQFKNAGILDTLAAAYAEAGDFERAAQVATEAIRLADPSLADRIRRRKSSYQRSLPHRQ